MANYCFENGQMLKNEKAKLNLIENATLFRYS